MTLLNTILAQVTAPIDSVAQQVTDTMATAAAAVTLSLIHI